MTTNTPLSPITPAPACTLRQAIELSAMPSAAEVEYAMLIANIEIAKVELERIQAASALAKAARAFLIDVALWILFFVAIAIAWAWREA